MLIIKNLYAKVEGREILKGLDLEIGNGEVHALMGPNGSGKSTLASVLTGRKEYEVTEGKILIDGENLLDLSPEERAHKGLFLAFQYPVEIPGVSVTNFLKAAINENRKAQGKDAIDPSSFLKLMKEKLAVMDMNMDMAKRSLNEGFSGGEKKRNEIFQMLMLEPKLAILDETDSGLDIDALKIVSKGVNAMRSPERSFLVITHYQRLLDYIIPDFVHVLYNGKIVRSGGKELALELEKRGYDWLKEEEAAVS